MTIKSYILKILQVLIVLINYSNSKDVFINIKIILENNVVHNMSMSQNDLGKYKILNFYSQNKTIKKFESDKYYLNRLQEVINSIKIFNNNKSNIKQNAAIANKVTVNDLFKLIFQDIIIKVIRTYRFIFNNIDGKLNNFYDKYCKESKINVYMHDNKKLDKIYKEFKDIIMGQYKCY